MSDSRRCCNDRRWKLHAWTTLVMCWSNDKEVSSVTPSSLTASENWISALATLMVWLKSTPTSRSLVANNTASVLLGFSSSAFWWNHSETVSEQCTSGHRSSSCDAVRAQWSIRSSAYWWCWIPKVSTTCPIGDTYIAKSKGPRIEPWGTPKMCVSSKLCKPQGFGLLRTNGDILRPVCDEGLYPSTVRRDNESSSAVRSQRLHHSSALHACS